jgi:hypothetical protein
MLEASEHLVRRGAAHVDVDRRRTRTPRFIGSSGALLRSGRERDGGDDRKKSEKE